MYELKDARMNESLAAGLRIGSRFSCCISAPFEIEFLAAVGCRRLCVWKCDSLASARDPERMARESHHAERGYPGKQRAAEAQRRLRKGGSQGPLPRKS